jgi:hypothetical protein
MSVSFTATILKIGTFVIELTLVNGLTKIVSCRSFLANNLFDKSNKNDILLKNLVTVSLTRGKL